MLYAILVICFFGGECTTLEDTRGPYETRVECRERLDEMRATAERTLPPHRGRMICSKLAYDELLEMGAGEEV